MYQRDIQNRLRIIEENTTGRKTERSGILHTGNTKPSLGVQIQNTQNHYPTNWHSPF